MIHLTFGWIDYFLFGSLLGMSLLIGTYFGFCSKQDSVSEYLFGGKSMGYIPVATSIVASLLSGITFLGVPTETYLHGAFYFWTVLNTITTGFLTIYIFIPVFYKLQVSSTYEYLELRFSRKIRSLASLLYILSLLIYIPIVIYVPALAFSQVTSISLHKITPIICIICITYTTIGGVKAVIWTDTIQFAFTISGLITVLIFGISAVGGLMNIWKIADAGGRLDIFDFNPSPFSRNTFWGMSVGSLFSSLSHHSVGQKFIQRYLAIGRLNDINKAVIIKTIATVIVDSTVVFTGLVMYAHYHDCDPISAKYVERSDQIVPYYVMDITNHVPGITGIFLAGIVSSALSTMSASINTLSGIIYDDFIDRWMCQDSRKESRAANIMKIISVTIGVISIGLIFAIEHLGTVLEMSYSIRGAADGTLLGLFLLGMFFPCVDRRGALVGGVVSFMVMLWIAAGAKYHMINGRLKYSNLLMSTANCSYILNGTSAETSTKHILANEDDQPMILFQLSFLYFSFVGSLIVVIVGLITNFILGGSDLSEVDSDHITPIIRRFLPKKKYTEISLNNDIPAVERSGNEK